MLMKAKKKLAYRSVLTMAAILLLASCGNGNTAASPSASAAASPPASASPAGTAGSGIDWEARKAENQKAGKITYTTGYFYAASSPDVQAVVARDLGYFEELGLDVDVQPGLDSEGMKYLAAGQAQISSAGNPSLVIQSVASGAGIKGVATFGSVGVNAIMVMEDSDIQSPKDLAGKTLGYKGAIPPWVVTMLAADGVDVTDIKAVSVGYDPRILAGNDLDALTVFKTNEPYIMEKEGYKTRLIDPGDFGGETSFGVVAVNSEFAEAHPTAVEDFLRALSKAHEWVLENPDEAIERMASHSETGYDVAAETNRWTVESSLIADHLPAGQGVAVQTDEQWQREIDMLVQAKVIPKALPLEQVMDNAYIDSIYADGELIWP